MAAASLRVYCLHIVAAELSRNQTAVTTHAHVFSGLFSYFQLPCFNRFILAIGCGFGVRVIGRIKTIYDKSRTQLIVIIIFRFDWEHEPFKIISHTFLLHCIKTNRLAVIACCCCHQPNQLAHSKSWSTRLIQIRAHQPKLCSLKPFVILSYWL